METYWYRTPCGQLQIPDLPIMIGDWLNKQPTERLFENLTWLLVVVGTVKKQFGSTLVPRMYTFHVPYEYEVLVFVVRNHEGNEERIWVSKTKLPFPPNTKFNPNA